MHDFAKTTKKRPGFTVSPFTVYKQQQQRKALSVWMQKALIALSFVGISLGLSCALLAFFFLHTSSWRGNTPLGIVVLTSDKNQILKDTNIIWIDPGLKEMSLLSIPGNLHVHTKQSGAYTLTALYGLYALDHETPAQFLKTFVRNVRIDSSFLVIGEGKKAPTSGTLRSFLLSTIFDTRGTYAFSFADRFALFWYALFGNARSVPLSFPQVVTTSEQGLDDLAYDTFVQKNFQNTKVKQEGLALSVVNASSQSRLASTVGRLFTVLGLNILSVSDTPNGRDEGVIVVRDGKLMSSSTVQMLMRYIGSDVKVSPETATEYRSDIVVFLGKKEATEFTP